MQKKRNSTGRVGTLWRNSRGRVLTEERTPERDLTAGHRWEPCRRRGRAPQAEGLPVPRPWGGNALTCLRNSKEGELQ